MKTGKGWGLEETEIDDVRRLMTHTNIYLLLLTAIASLYVWERGREGGRERGREGVVKSVSPLRGI